jgi:hypothetical protein
MDCMFPVFVCCHDNRQRILWAVGLILLLPGCSENPTDDPSTDAPPKTFTGSISVGRRSGLPELLRRLSGANI